MDKIRQYIKQLEDEYVEEDLDSLNPKDRLAFYLAIKEFEVPKLQRAGYMANAADIESIEVTYASRPKDETES